ncbi:EAL domain-containing protein [Roseococcus sp. SDR]|uniref:putative bifunctional diguanylate cyclase/phosphodiesterase n=1 Tax=Roseococcus sp. SDR TaxID=2835532 RepID=UPI001BCD983E|nr:EAL domain-containing protein [Roseococcus sp. SDR]MBS7790758.1 EAL domain-containing protein [Roseococcus sp. SDR]MBV1846072.1 EAL domain-containing protein [Roseococcus sp. SDR]
MPHPPRLNLPILRLGIALVVGVFLGLAWWSAPAWLFLPVLPFALLGWWTCRLRREVALWRQVMAATPYRVSIYAADQRLAWHNGRPGQGWTRRVAPLGRHPHLVEVMQALLAHLPPRERAAEMARRLDKHAHAVGEPFEVLTGEGGWERVRQTRLPGGEVAVFAVDISAVKRGELALAESEGRLRALLEMAPVGIWQLDGEGRTVFANRRLVALFGAEAPPGLADSGLLLTSAPDPDGPFGFSTEMESEACLTLPGQVDRRLRIAASPWVSAAHAATGDPAAELRGCILSVLDVTPLKAAQEQIEQLVERDPLTGLINRGTFRAALEEMLAAERRGVLVLVDIDQFKAANARHGQAVGDALLVEAGRRLREGVRPGDLVGRLGGDEFAVLAFGAGHEGAAALAERLRQALRRPVEIGGAEWPLSGSFGVACAPEHGVEADQLLRAADLALFEARGASGDAVALFEPALRARAEQRAELREAFGEALAAGELELHVQPQLDLESGRMVGAEALIRWDSARLGRTVPPAEMLVTAAEAGLMLELDRFVLNRAVGLLAAWGTRPEAPLNLGINISIATLHDPTFAAEVAEALTAAGVPPEQLEIEIPEDLAIRDLPGVARTLAALREVGVPLALDDFGGGHSGLPHVVRLPVQRLKLDRSITAGLPDDPKSYAVLRATMALARGMGIEVIGEGVETEEQALALRRAGCHIIQGWLVARPMPPEALVPPAPKLLARA